MRARRYGPLFGYLVASAIFTVLLYALAFNARDDSIKNCEQRNAQFAEVNQRAPAIDSLADVITRFFQARLHGDRSNIAEGVPADRAFLDELRPINARPVHLNDCHATFGKPWPF